MSAVASTSSTSVNSVGQKVSMLVAKSGFVIPKNKLSGSLVPVSRDGKKASGHGGEARADRVKRKTRWGPDLTCDTAVKKGRALAYQTRLDQITQQLQSGILDEEISELDGLANSSHLPVNTNNTKLLELEQREVIGEILTLNPSYKPPIDYKPLLKEESYRVPIEVCPVQKVFSVLLGPRFENLKSLEKETGVKMRVFGTKQDSQEEVQIGPSDSSASEAAFKSLSISITAESYDKIDETVSLLELLMENLAKEDQNPDLSSSPPHEKPDVPSSEPPSSAAVDLQPQPPPALPYIEVSSSSFPSSDSHTLPPVLPGITGTPFPPPPIQPPGGYPAPLPLRNIAPPYPEPSHVAPFPGFSTFRGNMVAPMQNHQGVHPPEAPRFLNPAAAHPMRPRIGDFPYPFPDTSMPRFPPMSNQIRPWGFRRPPPLQGPPFRPPPPPPPFPFPNSGGRFIPAHVPNARYPGGPRFPPRFAAFPGSIEPLSVNMNTNMQPRSLAPVQPRPVNRPARPNNVQIYDPFSPTAAAAAAVHGDGSSAAADKSREDDAT